VGGGPVIGGFGDLVVFSFHPNKEHDEIEGGGPIAHGRRDARRSSSKQYRFERHHQRNAGGEIDVMFPGGKAHLTDVAAQFGPISCAAGRVSTRAPGVGPALFRGTQKASAHVVLPARGDSGPSWHMFQC